MAHRGELISYASTIVGDRGDAEDVVQEAYIRFERAERSRTVTEPIGYLYRIVRNLSLDGVRRDARGFRGNANLSSAEVESLESIEPSPEESAEKRNDLRIVLEALEELPERHRIALEMHRFGGFTIRQIADRLNVSTGRAHSLVAESVDHCRQRLMRT